MTMEEKVKKHVKILEELKHRRMANELHCKLNSCEATSYMQGSNKILDDMIVFIENLNK
jgi:hypothetical protein